MSGERRARRRAASSGPIAQPPWSRWRNPLPPLKLLDDGALDSIENTAFRVLEELGLEFMSEEAVSILERHGARVVDRSCGLVTLDRDLVRHYVRMAPSQFRLHARNPERDLIVGGDWINVHTVGGAPNVSDLDRGRRPGTYADLCNLIKLQQSLSVVQFCGGSQVEAQDLPVPTRHLDMHRAQVHFSDKVFGARGIGRDRIRDAITIVELARGVTRETLQREPSTYTITNTNSPRRVDRELLSGLMQLAENGQAICVTPFTLAGAMAPITLAGALAQQHAEALGVIAFTQMVRPGAPAIYGGFTSNVDMKSGAPMFGTAEYVRATIIGGQLARRHGLPYRASNVTASNAVDAQAASESAMSIWACVMSHANMIHHGTGWLEGGLVASFEKVILDAEMLGVMRAWLAPQNTGEEELAFEAIKSVNPGGHFFASEHTMARYENAFHPSLTADGRNFEAWQEAGAPDATQRANAIWKRVLANYEAPPLESDRAEAIDAHIARRREDIARNGLA
jgi:trimethylamine--corrinoid protein Co-methyltransferase